MLPYTQCSYLIRIIDHLQRSSFRRVYSEVSRLKPGGFLIPSSHSAIELQPIPGQRGREFCVLFLIPFAPSLCTGVGRKNNSCLQYKWPDLSAEAFLPQSFCRQLPTLGCLSSELVLFFFSFFPKGLNQRGVSACLTNTHRPRQEEGRVFPTATQATCAWPPATSSGLPDKAANSEAGTLCSTQFDSAVTFNLLTRAAFFPTASCRRGRGRGVATSVSPPPIMALHFTWSFPVTPSV